MFLLNENTLFKIDSFPVKILVLYFVNSFFNKTLFHLSYYKLNALFFQLHNVSEERGHQIRYSTLFSV